MGRTIATFHQLIEQSRARFLKFRRALRREDQQVFDELFARAKYYAASGSMEAAWNPLEAVFLALFLEQQKNLHALEARLQALENAHAAHEPAPSRSFGTGVAAGSLPDIRGDGSVGD